MSQRLVIDRTACAGHGVCYGNAPELLDSDDQGDPVLLTDPIPGFLVAQHAVKICPERALGLQAAVAR